MKPERIREDERRKIATWIREEYRADGLDDGHDLVIQQLADRIERGDHASVPQSGGDR